MKYRGERDRKSSTVRSSRKASEKLALEPRRKLPKVVQKVEN